MLIRRCLVLDSSNKDKAAVWTLPRHVVNEMPINSLAHVSHISYSACLKRITYAARDPFTPDCIWEVMNLERMRRKPFH